MSKTPVCYVVTYRDQKDNAIHELKVRTIEDSSLGLSFIAVSGFLFEPESRLLRPDEEAKRQKFENIKTLHLSIYTIISIAEMGADTPKLAFKKDKSNLFVLPTESQNNHHPE